MGFFDALFGNAKLGIQISNQVIKVLLKDKGLFAYPIVMAIISFILLLLIFIPFVLAGGLTLGPLAWLIMLVIYYIVTTFFATYFLFAMYTAFKSFVAGKKMGMGEALANTGQYLGEIISWTLFYTVVATIVRVIESRSRGIVGFLIRELVAIGFFLGMTFAIPVIYEDHVGPIEAVKRSAMFIVNNIGKTFSGIIYFDVIAFAIKAIGAIFIISAVVMGILDLMGVSVMLGGFTILGHSSLLEIAGVFIFGLAIYIIGMLFNYVTLHIYYLVIYEYVKNGKAPKGMDETLIKRSIKKGAAGSAAGGQGGKPFGGLFQSGAKDDDSPQLNTFVK